jgi:urease accessory protein
MTHKRILNIAKIVGLVWLGLMLAIKPATAHHAMGGRTPANFFEGFLSGLAHPVIGLDHLAFVVAIGLIAAGRSRGAFIPAAFLLAAMAGTGIHVLSIDLPAVEIVIATSVIALGGMLALEKHPNFTALAVLVTIAGLFHGYAYGEAIVGAEMTPLVAYLAGFILIQYAIAMLALEIGKVALSKAANNPISLIRFSGSAICLIGVVFLAGSIVR